MKLNTSIATALLGLSCTLTANAEAGFARVGHLTELSQDHVLAASQLITSGKVYSLAIVTGPDTPAFGHRNYQMLTDNIYVGDSKSAGSNKLEGYDDLAVTWLGIGTQIDGFGHVALDGKHYGNVPSSEVIRPDGAIRYSIDTVPPIIGRGILLDVAAAAGVGQLSDGAEIQIKDLRAALTRQNTSIKAGDVVLIHTGWLSVANENAQRFLEQTPGLHASAAAWLADQKVVAIGADLWALEPWPGNDDKPDQFLPAHGLLLVERGVHILENINTADLAKDQAYEFFFMLAAPRLKGALQSPVHPVAIR